MLKKTIKEKFQEFVKDLVQLKDDKEKKRIAICSKIIKLLQTKFEEPTDFDDLIELIDNISDKKYNAEILKLILEIQQIPSEKMNKYRKKLLKFAFVLQPEDKQLKIASISYGTEQCTNVNTDKRTAGNIATFMLFDCLLCDPSRENLILMSNLLNSDIDIPRLLLDLIIVTILQIAISLINKGKYDGLEMASIHSIYQYYFTRAKSKTFFYKKMIIGLLSLEFELEGRSLKSISWNIIRQMANDDSLDITDLLLDILRKYFTERNYLQTLFSFEQYNNYLSFIYIEDKFDTNVKRSEQYKMFYNDFQKKLFENNNNKKETIRENVDNIMKKEVIRDNIKESVFSILKNLYIENHQQQQLSRKTFTFNFPLTNLLDFLNVISLEIIEWKENLLKALVDLLMTLTIIYKDEIIVVIYDIFDILALRFCECNCFKFFEKDPYMKKKGKDFIDVILSFVVDGKIPINKYSVEETQINSTQIDDLIGKINQFIKKNPIQCESTLILKAIYYFENFKHNHELIFKDLLIKVVYPSFNGFIIELLSYNYLHFKNRNEIIEDNISTYMLFCVNAFCNHTAILNSFTHLLTDIMLLTKRETFFKGALNTIILVTEPNQLLNFQVNALTILYDKLNKNYEYDKLMFANYIVIRDDNFMNKNTSKFMLPFLKKITVNKDCEVFFSKPFFSNMIDEETLPSQIVLNPNKDKIGAIHKVCDQINNTKYVLWNHIRMFNFLLKQVELADKSTPKDDFLLENLLELFSIFTRQIFPLKYINLEHFIKVLSNKSYLIQKTNAKIDQFALSVFVFLCYHCNSNMVTYQNPNNYSILTITDSTHKTQLLEIFYEAYSYLIDQVMIALMQDSKYRTNQKNHYKSTNDSKLNISYNRRSSSSSGSGSTVTPTHPNQNNNTDDFTLDTNIKIMIKNISKILSTLHYYLNSITEYDNNNHLPQFTKPSNERFKNFPTIDNEYSLLRKYINKLLGTIANSLWVFQFKLRYGISIVNMLLGIKELLFKLGDEVIIKVIIIAFEISWHKEGNFSSRLEEEFKIIETDCIKRDIFIDIYSKPKRKQLQYGFLQYLSDTLAIYFMERFSYSSQLLDIINEMIQSVPGSFRKYLFLELCKWHLSSRTFRDNLKSFFRYQITDNNQILLGKRTIIILSPNSQMKTDLIIRSTIINLCTTITARFDKHNYIDAFKFLKTDQRPRSTTGKDQPHIQLSLPASKSNLKTESNDKVRLLLENEPYDPVKEKNNSLIIFQQLINLTSEPLDAFELCCNNKLHQDKIMQLDSESVYTVFHCSVLFAPTNCLDNEIDLFAYNDEVSEEYIAFLHKLGYLYSIRDNKQINIGEMGTKGKSNNGNYVICHQDSLFQLVFQVSHLITTPNEDKEPLDKARKRIMSKNFVNIIWMDNPYKTFNEKQIEVEDLMIYFVIFPISSTHYVVKKIYNKPSDEKLCRRIKKELLEEFMININDTSSIMYLIQCIIQINMMREYFIEFKKVDKEYGPVNDFIFDDGLKGNYLRRYNMISNIISNNKDNK